MMQPSQTSDLLPGFDNAAFESHSVFRTVLDAMSRPGRIYDLPVHLATPSGLNASANAFLLAMADMDTTVWLSPTCATDSAKSHLKFHCGCPIDDDARQADFAVARIDEAMSYLTQLSPGNAEYPDQSATLILLVDDMTDAPSMTLTGPGIKDTHGLTVPGLPDAFHDWRRENHLMFPCGVDVVFATENRIAALPRTTRIEVK